MRNVARGRHSDLANFINCIQRKSTCGCCMSSCCYPSGSLDRRRSHYNAPEGMQSIPMIGMPDMKFAITVSAYDCTGCGSCANVCPGKKGEKALVMGNMEENAGKQTFFDYGRDSVKQLSLNTKASTVKEVSSNSRFLSSRELVRDVERHRTQN